MKKLLVAASGLIAVSPVYAVSIVSLHGGMVAPMVSAPVDTAIVAGSVLMLAGVIGLRIRARKLSQQQD